MKAWLLEDDRYFDPEESEFVYAENRNKARTLYSWNAPYVNVKATRAPYLDDLENDKVAAYIAIVENGGFVDTVAELFSLQNGTKLDEFNSDEAYLDYVRKRLAEEEN